MTPKNFFSDRIKPEKHFGISQTSEINLSQLEEQIYNNYYLNEKRNSNPKPE